MSGLIWAGIGKGIADAGQTFAGYMAKDIEATRLEEREALREERLLRRQEALDQLKADREEAKTESLKRRVATESVEIEQRAAAAPARRESAALGRDAQALAKSSAQAGEQGDTALGEDQLKGLLQNDPKLRESYAKSGIIGGAIQDKMDPRMRAAEDQAQAALEIGASSSVIEAYSKKRRDVLDQIRLEIADKKIDSIQAVQLAAINERGRQFDEKKPIEQQKADALTTRATRPAGGGGGGAASGSKVRSTYTDDNGQQVAVMSDGSTKVLGNAAAYNKSVGSLIAQREKNDYKFNKLPESEKKAWALERLASPGSSGAATKNYSNLWK
jgi:hypothetical protein